MRISSVYLSFLNGKEELEKMAFSKHGSEAASCLVKENLMTSSVCCVCLSDMKDPRLLACLHSCCRPCLDKMSVTAGRQRKIACPVCRASCTLPPNGAGGLPKDFTRVSERSSAVKCWEEDCDAKAALWCKECERAFCKQHGAMHLVSSQGDHTIGPIPTKAAIAGDLSRSAASCHDHGEPLVFFCVKCDEMICAHCTAIGKHHGHQPIVPMEEVTTRKKKEAIEVVDKIRKDLVPNVGASLEAVRDRTAELTKNASETRGEIRRAEERAIGMVKAYAEQLVEKVDAVEETRCKDLDKQKDTLESHLQSLQNAVQFFDHLMEKEEASGNDFAGLLDALVARSTDLSKVSFEKKPARHARLDFKAVSDKDLLANLEHVIGVVMSHDAVASKCTVESFSPTIQPGKHVKVTIQTCDSDGDKLTEGGQLVKALLTEVPDQPTCPPLEVKDLNDGRYLVSFLSRQPGKYHLQISVNSENMPEPIVVTCFDDHRFDPSECHGNISLSADHLRATRLTDGNSQDQCRDGVLGVVGMHTGRHSWKVQVGENPFWSFVGIIQKPLPPIGGFSLVALGWNSSGKRHTLPHNWSSTDFSRLQGNDIVQLDLDCDQHTLKITVLRTGESGTITGLTPNTEYFQSFLMEHGKRGMTLKLV